MDHHAIIFDLDGTLTDSGEGITKSVKPALEHFGIRVESLDDLRFFVGPPLRDSFIQCGVPEDQVEEAIRIYRQRYIPIGLFENYPYPGIREMLNTLRTQGYRLFVATSKPENMAWAVLDKFELSQYFEEICGATMDKSRDSKSAVIAYLLDKIGTETHAVMVGDTAFDVIGAKAHGIPTIGVSWGYGSVTEMEESGAVAIADTVEELLALVQKGRIS